MLKVWKWKQFSPIDFPLKNIVTVVKAKKYVYYQYYNKSKDFLMRSILQ